MSNENNDSEFDIPSDAPEPPAGFGEPAHANHAPEEPPRFDCLVCDRRYLTDDELQVHVEKGHSQRDLYTEFRPINFPLVAWYSDSTVPYTVYTTEAAKYARKALDDEGVTPEPVRRFTDERHPVSDEPIESSHPATLERGDDHSVWELYEALRECVPDEFEWSPVFDDGGYDEPAATVNRLQPGDAVAWRADGWTQSLGTPRGQTRDQISEDDDWQGEGGVTSVEDNREGPNYSGWDDGVTRQVTVIATTDLHDKQIEVQLEPRSDGEVLVSLHPRVTQERASHRHGHGSAGDTRAYVRGERDIDRLPWWERE